MTTIDCFDDAPAFPIEDCAARCIHCGSTQISESDIGTIYCRECEAHEDDCGIFPQIDALESLISYNADAPMGEAPAIEPQTPRKPATRRTRRKESAA